MEKANLEKLKEEYFELLRREKIYADTFQDPTVQDHPRFDEMFDKYRQLLRNLSTIQIQIETLEKLQPKQQSLF